MKPVVLRPRDRALALLVTWTVDGCYALYWSIQDPAALALMRDVNWPTSLCPYWACGLVWSVDRLNWHSSE